MSTIYTTDWIKFLGQDSELPPDVTFCVVQSTGTFKVRAHKQEAISIEDRVEGMDIRD